MRCFDEVDLCCAEQMVNWSDEVDCSGGAGLSYAGQLPRLGRDEIAVKAEALLDECWDGCLPIDVEAICDYLGIAIVPVKGLREELGVEAYTAVDFKTIYADWVEYESESVRYRFSVAHELGHYVLHQMYYPCEVGSFEEWRYSASNMDYVEYQANYFAGSLLAPEMELVGALNVKFDGSFARNCWCWGRDEFRRALGDVRKLFRISEQALARRMRDLMPGAEQFDEVAMGLGR